MRLTVYWMPEHEGVEGNEDVDEEGKQVHGQNYTLDQIQELPHCYNNPTTQAGYASLPATYRPLSTEFTPQLN